MTTTKTEVAAAPTTPATPALPEGHVLVRITKAGSGKIFTGADLVIGQPPETFKRGDMVVMVRETAKIHEKRHFVEIEGEESDD